jgi:hypothetical protein
MTSLCYLGRSDGAVELINDILQTIQEWYDITAIYL